MNRAIYDIPRAQFEETVEELVRLELGDLVQKPTASSLGERMKCELAAALLHRPRVLFLDEPTIGLDVSMQATVRSFIRAYNERFGATVLLTSHYMEDVVQLCPRVIVIDRGRLIYDGDLRALALKVRPDKRIVVRFQDPNGGTPKDLARFGQVVSREPGQATIQVAAEDVSGAVARMLGALGDRGPHRRGPAARGGDVGAVPGVAGAGDGGGRIPLGLSLSKPEQGSSAMERAGGAAALRVHRAPLHSGRARREVDAQVLARELHGGEDGQHRVALAVPRASVAPTTVSARAVIRFASPRSLPFSGVASVTMDTNVPVPTAAPHAPSMAQEPPRMGATRRRASATRSARRCGSRFTFE